MKTGARTPNASKVKLTNHQRWLADRIREGAEVYYRDGHWYCWADGYEFFLLPRTVEILKMKGVLRR